MSSIGVRSMRLSGKYAHFPSTTVTGERGAAPSMIGVSCSALRSGTRSVARTSRYFPPYCLPGYTQVNAGFGRLQVSER